MTRTSSLIVILVASAANSAASLQLAGTGVESGDFLISRSNGTQDAYGTEYNYAYGLAAISPSGSVRFSLSYPQKKEDGGFPGQTAITPDGKYAFATYDFFSKGPAILVIRLIGDSPKIVRIIMFPKSECVQMPSMPIAVGPSSHNVDYAIYVGRACYYRCPIDYTVDILQLRYNPSSDKFVFEKKLAYEAGDGTCRPTEYPSQFEALQVIKGELYGIRTLDFRLMRLSSNATTTPRLDVLCVPGSFAITSPTSFSGLCYLNSTSPRVYSVSGSKVTPDRLRSTKGGGGIEWNGSVASTPGSGSIYVIGEKNGKNYVYKLDSKLEHNQPDTICQIPPPLLAKLEKGYPIFSLKQLLIVPTI